MTTASRPLPSGIWDCHFHIMDPDTFPYGAHRSYTPAGATMEMLRESTPAQNFLLVQASVEDGEAGILHHLERAKTEWPNSIWRAEIEVPKDRDFSKEDLEKMHELGVRVVRLHGEIGNTGSDPNQYIKEEFVRLAKVCRETGWIISSMSPLTAWIEVIPWLVTDPQFMGIRFIIEHSARADPKRDVHDYPELDKFLQLALANKDRIYVKVCGINRRELPSDPPGKMKALPQADIKIATTLPDNVIWGSDWPHTNSHGQPREEWTPNKAVDLHNELNLLQQALPEDLLDRLLVGNAAKLFSS
ncbi:hypothetical protein NA57DRAFT_76312 [Rhizodiscina lignyota]|uniref:Amidohydrolase-related domain-containing protein n=1 Tax=Rhizodiscina lignyota TaxID=1504668 RepID=A0A9P4IFJ5_9PEZI|nr:hypothetical protein NA57DRAFT_76312 [Rhizodiscina lignyota]